MTLTEIISKIDKSKENEAFVDINAIGNLLGITINYYKDQDRLKCYWIGNWSSSDTWLGHKLYFYDGDAVAYSRQMNRRSDERIQWFSTECVASVRDYIISLLEKQDVNNDDIEFCKTSEDIGDSYKIAYNDDLLTCNIPMYKGQPVSIVKKNGLTRCTDKMLKIKLPNNETEMVNIDDLDFKFYLR